MLPGPESTAANRGRSRAASPGADDDHGQRGGLDVAGEGPSGREVSARDHRHADLADEREDEGQDEHVGVGRELLDGQQPRGHHQEDELGRLREAPGEERDRRPGQEPAIARGGLLQPSGPASATGPSADDLAANQWSRPRRRIARRLARRVAQLRRHSGMQRCPGTRRPRRSARTQTGRPAEASRPADAASASSGERARRRCGRPRTAARGRRFAGRGADGYAALVQHPDLRHELDLQSGQAHAEHQVHVLADGEEVLVEQAARAQRRRPQQRRGRAGTEDRHRGRQARRRPAGPSGRRPRRFGAAAIGRRNR